MSLAKKTFLLLIVLVFALQALMQGSVMGMSEKQKTLYRNNVLYYDVNACEAVEEDDESKEATPPIRVNFQNIGRQDSSPKGVFEKIKNASKSEANVIYNFAEINEGNDNEEREPLKEVFGAQGWSALDRKVPTQSTLKDYKITGSSEIDLYDGLPKQGVLPRYLVITEYEHKQDSKVKIAMLNSHFIFSAYNGDKKAELKPYWDQSWSKLKQKVEDFNKRDYNVIISGDFNRTDLPKPHPDAKQLVVGPENLDYIFAVPANGGGVSSSSGVVDTPSGEDFHKNIWADVKFESKKDAPKEEKSDSDKSVYMVGDSITVAAKDNLESELKAKDMSPYINASVGRSITGKGTTAGLKTSGLEAAEDDKERIEKSGAVVIALGTNQNNDFGKSIEQLTDRVRSYNKDAKIYWVNIFSQGKVKADDINKDIEKASKPEGFEVIDTTKSDIKLSGDDIHPTSAGSKTFAETVASGVNLSGGIEDEESASGGCKCGGDGGGDTTLTGSNDEEKIFNFFVSKGLEPYMAAGIMGNMKSESVLNPKALQPGTTGNAPIPGRGYGLVQWTFPARQDPLIKKAKEAGKKVYDLGIQLEYVLDELKGSHKTAGENLKKTKNVEEATLVIELEYEVHAGGVQPQRTADAKAFLAKYGSGGGGKSSSTSDTKSCSKKADGSGEVAGEFGLPIPKKWYKSNPGYFTGPHHGDPNDPGVDIPVPRGTNVYSITDGTVTAAPNEGGYGLGVNVEASNGVVYVYGHGTDGGSVKGAKKGDKVKAGQLIMHVNDTGESRGDHLHLSILVNGKEVCPQKFLVSIAKGDPLDPKSLPSSGCTSG